jgi:hypothetical protein
MSDRILADIIMVIHFLWIIFMLIGFVLTVRAFWKPAFFDRWVFRTIHLAGILFVAAWELLGKYCPLTLWENALRRKYDPDTNYPGSFIIGHLEDLIYPDVSPLVVMIPTIFIALFILIVFITRPPSKFQRKASQKIVPTI